MIKVSVIIPVFNSEKYLRECLDSVVGQTLAEIEIICVNDGSSDSSLDILKEYQKKDERIVIINQENKGAGYARNKGIEIAKGKYLSLLDSDDFFKPDMLENMYNKAQKTNAQIVICKSEKLDNNTRKITSMDYALVNSFLPQKDVFSSYDIKEHVFNFCCGWSWDKLYLKDFIIENKIKFQNLKNSEDAYFTFISLALANKITTLQKIYVTHRENIISQTSQNRDKNYNCAIEAVLEIHKTLVSLDIYKHFKESFKAWVINFFDWYINTLSNNANKIKLQKETKKVYELLNIKYLDIETIEQNYINLINKIPKDKKIMFWGASIFLEELIEKYNINNDNIIGIIDKNSKRQNEKIGKYEIFTPEKLSELKPQYILFTIKNNNKNIYNEVEKYLKENNPNIMLLENIFEKNDIINKKQIKVSIVVPVFNAEKYLRECLDSIIAQTLAEIEIICVNDGSSDSSLDILKEYQKKDERIVIINQENKGYGYSMNFGFKQARGEYLGIVEPDDYIKSDMLEKLYQIANEHDLDFIKSNHIRFTTSDNNKKPRHANLTSKRQYYNKVINLQEDLEPFEFVLNTWSGIYKKDFIFKNNIKHNETKGASYQDTGFWFQTFCLAKKVYFLNESFYYHRMDNINSSTNNKEKVYCMKEEYDYIKDFLEENNLLEKYIAQYITSKFKGYIFTLKRIGSFNKKVWLEIFRNDFIKLSNTYDLDKILNSNKILKKEIKTLIKKPVKFYRNFYIANNTDTKDFSFINFLNRTNKKKKIAFWGASIFLEELIEKYNINNDNIIGIIDKNSKIQNEKIGKYEIFSPDKLLELKPDCVVLSIFNNNKEIYKDLSKQFKIKYPKIKLVKNLFN